MSITKNRITIIMLRQRGVEVTPGSQYIPKSRLPKRVPSLKEIHKHLSKIKGSLAEEISTLREEEG